LQRSFFQGGLGQPAQTDGAFHGFARVVMMLPRPGQQTLDADVGVQFRPINRRAVDFKTSAFLRRGQRQRRKNATSRLMNRPSSRAKPSSSSFTTTSVMAEGVRIYWWILVFIASVFKPGKNYLRLTPSPA
jgi:hypothetical protein